MDQQAIQIDKGGSKQNNNLDVIKRIGKDFHEELESIKQDRLEQGMDKKKISNQKLTNQIIKHDYWDIIKEDLTNYEF